MQYKAIAMLRPSVVKAGDVIEDEALAIRLRASDNPA